METNAKFYLVKKRAISDALMAPIFLKTPVLSGLTAEFMACIAFVTIGENYMYGNY